MRASGILMPVSSLPSPFGVGCFSREAYEFVDWLAIAGQHFWQILPLGPTGYGDSPYQSFSTFAGNPYFIDLETLIANGLLSRSECGKSGLGGRTGKVDYARQYSMRYPLLRKAFERWKPQPDYHTFLSINQSWLDDYALFMAVKEHFGGVGWIEWDRDIRAREPEAVKRYSTRLEADIRFHKFLQYEFSHEWSELKAYANDKGIQIIGDIPIYVSPDSSDVWANPELFELDADFKPLHIAGVPPDGFSADGQVWGNPLYNWKHHLDTGCAWWVNRMEYCFTLFDIVRIDHFRGFDEYYQIPFGASSAACGEWRKGPGKKLFDILRAKLGSHEVIAEDLGYLTDSVRQLVKDCGFPGMKILEFAFDSRDSTGAEEYLPYRYPQNCVVYTGTHDNETIMGWYASILPEERELVCRYLGRNTSNANGLNWDMIRLALGSVAKWCVIPMQDVLGLDNRARMNHPSTLGGNWQWRAESNDFSLELAEKLKKLTQCYGRT